MRQPSKKTALVTGGSRGIGQAIVRVLMDEGFDVVNADVSVPEQKLEGCHFVETDISEASHRQRLVDDCRKRFEWLDLLVNNAGVSVEKRGDMLETSEAEVDRLLSINLKGPYFLTQSVAKWMIESAEGSTRDSKPKIINIASLTSYVSATYMAPYGLSKAAVSMMTKLYADRLSAHGIHVYEIRPGIIKTPLTAPSHDKYDKFIEEGGLPIRRWGLPEDVAKAVLAVAKDLLPYSTGEVINVDGGYHMRRL